MTDFKWRHFQGDVILWAVRWYCRYPISYRDLEEMLAERGISVDHTTIYRWVQCYAPEMEKRLRWFWRRGFDPSWRLDETYVKVRGKWTYLYRAVDKLGEQTMLAFQKTEDANHFIRGQHHRQAPRRPRSSDLLKPGQIRAQHLAVEEQQGRQCLTMRGDRNLALVRQPGQKCLDFAAAQGCRVTHTVETDEGTNPVDISLFGS
ncbi:TPA_asm: IS6 family transposase [Salmonella enterica subsp. enterica serovar Mbandaka]|uniref:IS6 family transposase n=5 Tax=Gammaproteobacteria TaxID=1236 RepID=A0A6X8MPQ7_SALET|nr:IS6 family transposase [Salmonella enterica subsp. enterica serovar Infantis]HAB2052120.1 IS6 family transposase [Salmonella enterica subsp. enterica serovar Mbandaka]